MTRRRSAAPLLDTRFHLADFDQVDARLVGGSALFGLGWGLAGYCPGPAIVGAGVVGAQAVVFVAAMIGGMGLWELVIALRPAPVPAPASTGRG